MAFEGIATGVKCLGISATGDANNAVSHQLIHFASTVQNDIARLQVQFVNGCYRNDGANASKCELTFR